MKILIISDTHGAHRNFDRVIEKEQPLDTNLVKTYLNNVNALNLGTYVTYNATDEELV